MYHVDMYMFNAYLGEWSNRKKMSENSFTFLFDHYPYINIFLLFTLLKNWHTMKKPFPQQSATDAF